jgi:hypothetical protein
MLLLILRLTNFEAKSHKWWYYCSRICNLFCDSQCQWVVLWFLRSWKNK